MYMIIHVLQLNLLNFIEFPPEFLEFLEFDKKCRGAVRSVTTEIEKNIPDK